MRYWRWPKRGEVFGTEMRLRAKRDKFGGDAAAAAAAAAALRLDSLTIHLRANGSRLEVEISRLRSLQRSRLFSFGSPTMC